MKLYNDAGCTIDGVTEDEFPKFEKAGWMTEQKYKEMYKEE